MVKISPLAENIKQNIAQILNKNFVIKLLNDRLAEYYPDFVKIVKIKLTPYKKHLGVTSAVFVVEYNIQYLTTDQQTKQIEIFASAHSDSSRKGAYAKNKFIYDNGFSEGKYRATKPLFYLEEQYAYFYVSSVGRRLFSFFTENPQADLSNVFSLIAGWIKKLHSFDYQQDNFAWPQFSIAKMIPEPARFISDFKEHNLAQGELAEQLYKIMLNLEKEYSATINKALVYGDNHPENTIVASLETDYLEMIDFTDLTLADPMMDLGTFLQQFDFMGHNFISREKMNSYKIFFVEAYFEKKFELVNLEYIKRINLYQAWTALRSSTFLFYMKNTEHPITDLLADARRYLELIKDKQPTINLY